MLVILRSPLPSLDIINSGSSYAREAGAPKDQNIANAMLQEELHGNRPIFPNGSYFLLPPSLLLQRGARNEVQPRQVLGDTRGGRPKETHTQTDSGFMMQGNLLSPEKHHHQLVPFFRVYCTCLKRAKGRSRTCSQIDRTRGHTRQVGCEIRRPPPSSRSWTAGLPCTGCQRSIDLPERRMCRRCSQYQTIVRQTSPEN